jgi:Carboxypeptidase regulatory-like domain/TonB dependent receptor-like, beta-barrel
MSARITFFISPFILLFFTLGTMSGQTTRGTILGSVTDQAGAVVSEANVTLTQIGTGFTRKVVTNADGNYIVPSLLPGKYRIQAEKEGFQTKVINEIELNVEARLQVDISLSVRGAEEKVEITSEAPLVESSSPSLGQVINNKAVEELPLNGRNFLQLVLLSAGSAPLGTRSDTAGFNRPSVNISGGRESSNQFTIDGVFNNAVHFGGLNLQLSVDAIQEFKVQRNTFNAEFGQGTANVNVASKTGTNHFHGTVFEFLRNDVLDARQFFDEKVPPFRQNQFGASFGGPIIKDKTFFFGNYEGFRRRRANTLLATLPTAKQLSGDFSGGAPVRDPLTGQPFSGNLIPQDRISALTKRIIPVLPQLSVGGANNFRTAPSSINDFDQFTVRGDHRFSSSDSIFARYSLIDIEIFNPGITVLSGSGVTDLAHNAAIQWTHTFSPAVLNEFRLGFNRNLQNRLQEGAGGENILQFRNALNDPINAGLPIIALAGFTAFGSFPTNPEIVGGNVYQFDDTLTWVRGNHALKFGVDYRHVHFPHTPGLFTRGQFVFQGLATGNPVADFLLGHPFVTLGAGKVATAFATIPHFNWFVQDDWKLSPRLTLNLGLRYERIGAVTDRYRGYFSTFDEATGQLVTGADMKRLGLVNPDNNDFSPRFGFAWQPFGKSHTVIRGGYGVYYDVKPINERQFGLGIDLAWQQIVDTGLLLGLRPAVQWDNLFPASAGVGLGILADDPRARTPYVQQYSLGIQRELPGNFLVEAAYVGSVGRKLNIRVDINQARLPITPNEPLAQRRPYPNFGSIWTDKNIAISNYNSFQLRVEKRFSKNLYLLGVYTYSKSLDTGSLSIDSPQDRQNIRAEYGLSVFDQRQRFVFSSIYQLPFGKGQKYLGSLGGFPNALLSGWQVTSIVTFASGNPLTIAAAGSLTNTGCQGCVQRANLVGPDNGNLPSSERRVERWFNTSAFVLAPPSTFGNSGRNIVIGPGVNNFDLSLIKDIKITEDMTIQFRTEFFNAFNHTQFFDPVTDPTSPAFGRITLARPAREIQFGLKFIF